MEDESTAMNDVSPLTFSSSIFSLIGIFTLELLPLESRTTIYLLDQSDLGLHCIKFSLQVFALITL